MSENSVIRARIDEKTKAEAAAVLGAMGLTLSDAFRMLVRRIATEKALPFEPLVPNEETIAAMREARAGGLPQFKSSKDLLRELNEGD
jgi:DNA-damage-inducible protein J